MSTVQRVQLAGVIGAGGAGFPTHVKLNTKADFVLVNGAECEPLLRVDQQLMKAHAAEVIGGLLLAREATGAKQAIIGVKISHPDVIDVLRNTIDAMGAGSLVSVGELPDVYPAGDEQVLVYELTGRIVPETAIPAAVGCVVINSETALNLFHAVQDIPVTEKYVTVTGCVEHPMTVKVPVGTPVDQLLNLAGPSEEDYAIINGGPMMGPLLQPETIPADRYVSKKSKGYIVLPKDHPLILKKQKTMATATRFNRSACEQCSMCTDLCPRHLLGHSTAPHKMVRAMAYGLEADENMTVAQTCCQCNLCEYFSCPAGINPRMANLYYMTELREKGVRHTPKASFTVNPLRPYRQIPSKRLIARLGLRQWNVAAPLQETLPISVPAVAIGLKDHVGAPAVPKVSVGDQVQAGQLIAAVPEDALGANVHASISGVVEAIQDNLIYLRNTSEG